MARLVHIDELRAEHETWMSRLARAAEAWVNAKAAGMSTDELSEYARQMEEAERHTRRLERRIRRRKRDR